MKNEPKKYFRIDVLVETSYTKVIEAKDLKEAEEKARELNIQDDENCYYGTETMEPNIEECTEDGDDLE